MTVVIALIIADLGLLALGRMDISLPIAANVPATPPPAGVTPAPRPATVEPPLVQPGEARTAKGLTGWVDVVNVGAGVASVIGWAVDHQSKGPAAAVAAYADGRRLAWARPALRRQDVADALHVPSMAESGYILELTLPQPGGLQPVVHIVAFDGTGGHAELSYSAAYPFKAK
ncbi:hypothetical protein [Magnetospirillum sp. 15-1]|uniref:hypothetical protein n=1 Tax=Magnetospirillum sp. 15-1 TaxID=1979370 RepID=UPI001144002F|nr:hypothetical protein [Magnetospirillum sp. 15-1]